MRQGARIEPPRARIIVAAGVVDELVARRQAELARLEDEASKAHRIADEVEARVRAAGADESSTTWAMLQLRRFLDRVFDEVDQEGDAEIEVAERRARACVEAARAEAFRVAAFEPVEPIVEPMNSAEPLERFDPEPIHEVHTTLTVEDIEPRDLAHVVPEMDRAFWSDAGAKPRQTRRALGLPLSAGLRVSAVLLALVAVAVRVS